MTPDDAFDALRATWPPERVEVTEQWEVPFGAGGGQRVSSAVARVDAPDLAAMEEAHRAMGQTPAVQVRPGQESLDAQLEAAGYQLGDPTILLAGRAADMAKAPPPVTVFDVAGGPTAVQREIWAKGGIGPERLAVMDRAEEPKVTLLGRLKDAPLATAYVACHGNCAMLHGLEVLPEARRQGLAAHMMGAAALWAQNQGKVWLALAVTQGNAPARALYASLKMEPVGHYHYRKKPSG